jgi:hypothetical protein
MVDSRRKLLDSIKRFALIAAWLWFLGQLAFATAFADQPSSPASSSTPSLQSSAPPGSGLLADVLGLTSLLPRSVVLGSYEKGPLTLWPTLNQQFDGFREVNSGWGGKYSPPIEESMQFFEQANEHGLNARLNLDDYGTMLARVSAIFAMTGGGLNPLGTNYGNIQTDNYSIEDAYLKWSSGDLLPALGKDAIQLIGGRYTYRIGDGFLFYNGASGGGNRTTPWLAPHHAFAQSGIIRMDTGHVLLEGFYLSPSNSPKTHTRLAGINLEYRFSDDFSTGFTYANIFHSDTITRQGLNVVYWRGEGSPVERIKDFYFAWSVALESDGNTEANALGWYLTPSYTFSHLRWLPTLYYRYASFSGGGTNGNKEFDPLFYGFSDWGTWYQGDILGNWVTSNANLNSHQVRLNLTLEQSTVNLIYYHFRLDSEKVSKPVSPLNSKNLADELDLDWDFKITNWWVTTLMVGANVPGTAAKEMTGGGQTWFQAGLWSSWNF